MNQVMNETSKKRNKMKLINEKMYVDLSNYLDMSSFDKLEE